MSSFFESLEPGAAFRFNSPYECGGAPRDNWICAVFVKHGDKGNIYFRYWDEPHNYTGEWKKKEIPKQLEVWDSTITEEHLATPIYLASSHDEYILSPWTIGDLKDTDWINKYVHRIERGATIHFDRWGKLQLHYNESRSFVSCLTGRHPHPETKEYVLVIHNWDRYDTMSHEEKVERAEQCVAYHVQRTRSTQSFGHAPIGAEKELEEARRMYQELTGKTTISQEILNAGVQEGQQMSLL